MSEPPQPLSPGERAILDAIGGLHRRLDGLEARLTTVETQAMGLAGLVADTADQHIGRLQAQGVDVDARLAAGLRLAERMTRPEFTALVEHLIDESTQQREKIEELTQAVKGIGGMVAVGVDAFDGFAATVAAKGSPSMIGSSAGWPWPSASAAPKPCGRPTPWSIACRPWSASLARLRWKRRPWIC